MRLAFWQDNLWLIDETFYAWRLVCDCGYIEHSKASLAAFSDLEALLLREDPSATIWPLLTARSVAELPEALLVPVLFLVNRHYFHFA